VRLTDATRNRLRVALPIVLTVGLLAPMAYAWQASLVPDSYAATAMGSVDFGGGPVPPGQGHTGAGGPHAPAAGTISVDDLRDKSTRAADVRIDLVARQQELDLGGGHSVAGYSLNGTSPGPTITAVQGQLVEVRARNESVAAGIALHWHGLDVPNAMDGVAGVTQDGIGVGESFTYRFVADDVGTYWYHSHQLSDVQVAGGLFGALVVLPRRKIAETTDVIAVEHTYGGVRTLNGRAEDLHVDADPGERVRVRVVNTDNGSIQAWANIPFALLAIDGTEVNAPTPVGDQSVAVTGGARADLGVTMPADGSPVRVQVSRGAAVVLGAGNPPVPPQPPKILDPLSYGQPAGLGFDPAEADRRFVYTVGRRPGFVRGKPGLWWSINSRLYPFVPMYMVSEGDVVVMTITNRSGEAHPMHLHGHHAVVLARNGVAATGSPWWFDTLNVLDDETYEVAFVADNPGIWMDHCHNLTHAAQGMVAHLMYAGVTTPYALGGRAGNAPE